MRKVALWIADKFCIFAYLKQLISSFNLFMISCELLTNFVSLHIWNNWEIIYCYLHRLWIADKFCIFAYLKQSSGARKSVEVCCELLTNFVSLHIWNNLLWISLWWGFVVNCWQILYLCISETIYLGVSGLSRSCELLTNFVSLHIWNNMHLRTPICIALWIADKFCIFAYLKQLNYMIMI